MESALSPVSLRIKLNCRIPSWYQIIGWCGKKHTLKSGVRSIVCRNKGETGSFSHTTTTFISIWNTEKVMLRETCHLFPVTGPVSWCNVSEKPWTPSLDFFLACYPFSFPPLSSSSHSFPLFLLFNSVHMIMPPNILRHLSALPSYYYHSINPVSLPFWVWNCQLASVLTPCVDVCPYLAPW